MTLPAVKQNNPKPSEAATKRRCRCPSAVTRQARLAMANTAAYTQRWKKSSTLGPPSPTRLCTHIAVNRTAPITSSGTARTAATAPTGNSNSRRLTPCAFGRHPEAAEAKPVVFR